MVVKTFEMFWRSDKVNFFGGVLPALFLSYISLKAYWQQIEDAREARRGTEEGGEGGEGDDEKPVVDEKPGVAATKSDATFANPLQAPGGEDAAVTKKVRTHEV